MLIASGRLRTILLTVILTAYACGRVLEIVFGPVPNTPLVAIEVLSAMAFALVDGAYRYGLRGIAVFSLICIVVGNVVENIGLATGFPYGHYTFLGVMGPRIFAVPVLLGLAYIGMAYASWVLGDLIVGPVSARARIAIVPVVAAFVMVAWDLAQDPVWSTMLGAWVWHDGGAWFGVPISNYFGWFATILLICVLFALYLFRGRAAFQPASISAVPALLLYAFCAAGNMLQFLVRRTAAEVQDGSGRIWRVDDILIESALVSLFVMGAFAAIAAVRLKRSTVSTG